MPSSVSEGVRPRISSSRWYSCGVRPCWATISGVMARSARASIRDSGLWDGVGWSWPTTIVVSSYILYEKDKTCAYPSLWEGLFMVEILKRLQVFALEMAIRALVGSLGLLQLVYGVPPLFDD